MFLYQCLHIQWLLATYCLTLDPSLLPFSLVAVTPTGGKHDVIKLRVSHIMNFSNKLQHAMTFHKDASQHLAEILDNWTWEPLAGWSFPGILSMEPTNKILAKQTTDLKHITRVFILSISTYDFEIFSFCMVQCDTFLPFTSVGEKQPFSFYWFFPKVHWNNLI